MAFYTILTEVGKAKLANATALGTVVQLTDIAVGDGDGADVIPVESMTALTNQVWSGPINHLYIDSANANWIVSEGYIPTDVGDFTIREVGLFDADGDMIAVGNYPETYKPVNTSGSAKDLYLKVIIEVSNSSVVELKIDPAVVLASRKYVDDAIESIATNTADLSSLNEDVVFISDKNGVILVDRSLNGATWRLFVDNGNLGIEPVQLT